MLGCGPILGCTCCPRRCGRYRNNYGGRRAPLFTGYGYGGYGRGGYGGYGRGGYGYGGYGYNMPYRYY